VHIGRGRIFTAGILAAAAGLAVLWGVSGWMEGTPFAPAVMAETIVRLTPGDLATFFIESLGEWGLRLVNLGALAVALIAGALALVSTEREGTPRVATAAVTVSVLSMIIGLLTPMGNVNVLGAIVAPVCAGIAYWFVASRAFVSGPESEADPGRRAAIASAGKFALGITVGGAVAGWVARRIGGPDTNVVLVEPVMAAAAPDRSSFPDIPGLTPEITTTDDHYVVDINFFKPTVEADGWTLSVTGLVDESLEVGFNQLQEQFEVIEEYSVLTCVSNEIGGPLIGNSAWGGVRLADLLEAAGVSDGAEDVVFQAADGYSDSIPIDAAMDPHVLLAVSQNGRPLTQDHGFPCRVRAPSYYGMKNVKWVTAIVVVGSNYNGYWQKRGWSDVALVRTQSRIDVAGDDRSARVGVQTWIAGVAWAGDRGISRVEVSTDGGSNWESAQLHDPVASNSWSLWAYRWTPEGRGTATVVCRATDGNGDVQTNKIVPPHPAGATGYHTLDVAVT
jgi:DMSO/TMAO reductase YedYZ molybdopterin-dependent catalytic subunit